MEEKFYAVEQIAELLQLHPKTVQRYIREGKLRAQKIGKSWRVSGHALSLFTESEEGAGRIHEAQGLQEVMQESIQDIRVSTVIDVPVAGEREASLIGNWLTASMNACSSSRISKSMTSQYIESEKTLRIMLWGGLEFTETILASLKEMET
jgi:excisionase family DNA binding protein